MYGEYHFLIAPNLFKGSRVIEQTQVLFMIICTPIRLNEYPTHEHECLNFVKKRMEKLLMLF